MTPDQNMRRMTTDTRAMREVDIELNKLIDEAERMRQLLVKVLIKTRTFEMSPEDTAHALNKIAHAYFATFAELAYDRVMMAQRQDENMPKISEIHQRLFEMGHGGFDNRSTPYFRQEDVGRWMAQVKEAFKRRQMPLKMALPEPPRDPERDRGPWMRNPFDINDR